MCVNPFDLGATVCSGGAEKLDDLCLILGNHSLAFASDGRLLMSQSKHDTLRDAALMFSPCRWLSPPHDRAGR